MILPLKNNLPYTIFIIIFRSERVFYLIFSLSIRRCCIFFTRHPFSQQITCILLVVLVVEINVCYLPISASFDPGFPLCTPLPIPVVRSMRAVDEWRSDNPCLDDFAPEEIWDLGKNIWLLSSHNRRHRYWFRGVIYGHASHFGSEGLSGQEKWLISLFQERICPQHISIFPPVGSFGLSCTKF